MKAAVIIVLASMLFVCSTAAEASFYDGNKLLDHCTNTNDVAQGICIGYVTGAIDQIHGIQNANGAAQVMCIPEYVPVRQMIDIVVKYLRAHPEERHYIAATITYIAIRKAFPCS